jgi:chemotaxis protein methyltransferase CheR
MAHEGWDLMSYRPHQLFRRLRILTARSGAEGFAQYAVLLRRHPEKLGELRAFLGIKVTQFFRNPERFEYLEKEVLPLLACRNLRVWSAGCANGAEAYSLAMMLEDVIPGGFAVQATDMDEMILRTADDGWYPARDVALVSEARRQRYLVPSGRGFSVHPALRAAVFFRAHNLLSDPFPQGLDLVACRNVLIYLSDEAKAKVVGGLSRSLKPGGFLFVGSTESILNSASAGFAPCGPFFYRKIA